MRESLKPTGNSEDPDLLNSQITGNSLLVHATYPSGTKLSALWYPKKAVVLSFQMQRDRVTRNLVQPVGVGGVRTRFYLLF